MVCKSTDMTYSWSVCFVSVHWFFANLWALDCFLQISCGYGEGNFLTNSGLVGIETVSIATCKKSNSAQLLNLMNTCILMCITCSELSDNAVLLDIPETCWSYKLLMQIMNVLEVRLSFDYGFCEIQLFNFLYIKRSTQL